MPTNPPRMDRRPRPGVHVSQNAPHVVRARRAGEIRGEPGEVWVCWTGQLEGHNPRAYTLRLTDVQFKALCKSIAELRP